MAALLRVLSERGALRASFSDDASISAGSSNARKYKSNPGASESPRSENEGRFGLQRVGRHAHVKITQEEEKHSFPLAKVLPFLRSAQRWTCVRQLITALLFLQNHGVVHGNVCVDSVLALRNTDADVDPDEELATQGSEWIFKLILPKDGETPAPDSSKSVKPLVGIAPASCPAEPDADVPSGLEEDTRAFGKLALQILGDEVSAVKEHFVELSHNHPQATAIVQCAVLAGKKVRPPTDEDLEGSALSDVTSVADNLSDMDEGSPTEMSQTGNVSSVEFATEGTTCQEESMGSQQSSRKNVSRKRVSFQEDGSRAGTPVDEHLTAALASRVVAAEELGHLQQKSSKYLSGKAVETIYSVEGVWTILDKHTASRAKVHRCLLQASASGVSKRVSSIISELEMATRQDPFLSSAHVALALRAWEGRSSQPKPRSELVSLLQGGQGTPAVESEITSSLLRGGWLAEAWSYATNAVRALDAFEADWPRLLQTLSSAEAERLEFQGLCKGLRTLTAFLPGTRRGCKPGHRQLKRTLERLRSVALEKLSLLPVWPLLLPPSMARDAARVASQQAAFSQSSMAQFVLWHLASSLPTVTTPQDAVTHLLCSWPKGFGALGVHLVQPSGIVLWAESSSTPEPVHNTGSATTHSGAAAAATPPVAPSPFTAQVGLTLAALMAQQRLMVFLNYLGAEKGWETHLLRCVGMTTGVVRSALIQGSPQILLLLRADNTLERFVLQPQSAPAPPPRPSSPRPSSPTSPTGLAGLLAGGRAPKSGKEAVVMSSAVTVESLVSTLHVRSLRNAEVEVLRIICVSDGSQLLLPLRLGPSDLRLLVVEQILPTAAEPTTAEGNYFRAQQLHAFSMSKLPTSDAVHVPKHGSVKQEKPGDETTGKRGKLMKQGTFAAAAALATVQLQEHQEKQNPFISRHASGDGLRNVLRSAAARATLAGVRPTPVVTADAAFFFLPHIWEVLLCLETQLLWWKLPYPLTERAAGTTSEIVGDTGVLSGIDDMLSHGTQVHYLCSLPFFAWSWQLIIGKTRLVALVDMNTKPGSQANAKISDRRPHCFAICDAWYGDVMKMIELPTTLFSIIPVTPSVASTRAAEGSAKFGSTGGSSFGESDAEEEKLKTVRSSEWQPPYRIGASNNVIVVSVGGRAAFWPATELVRAKETKESTRAKFRHALRRLSILNMLVVQESNAPVDIEHSIIASGGRDGVVRPKFPATVSVTPAAVHDTPCLDWKDCLFLADIAFWSTGASLHALFHSMVGYNAAVAPGEMSRRPSFTNVAPSFSTPMRPGSPAASRPSSDASSPGKPRTSVSGMQQMGGIKAGVFLARMQKTSQRDGSSSPSASPSASLSVLATPRGSATPAASLHAGETPVASPRASPAPSPRGSCAASPRPSYNELLPEASPASPGSSSGSSSLSASPDSLLVKKKPRRGALSSRSKGTDKEKATQPLSLAQDLLVWAVSEPLPTATWLVEAWVSVDRVLAELRAHLYPLVTQALPVVTAIVEACSRVAAPIRPVLHERLQEICGSLTDCIGHTGPKAWGVTTYAPSTVSSFIVDMKGSDAALMIGHHHRPSPREKSHGIITSIEGTPIASSLQSAVLLSCGDVGGRVASVAMDSHGRRLMLAREIDGPGRSAMGFCTCGGPGGRNERWAIEFWQMEEQGRWTQRRAQQQAGHVHTSASPPICALSEGAVIGFTASESVYAWDCEDGELLFTLTWTDSTSAFGLWCSGDASRVAVATSTAVYLWKDGSLVQAMDYRAIVILAEQGQVRSVGGFGQTGFGQRLLTAAHCNFSADEDTILGAIVDSHWLAVFSLQPEKQAKVAYVLSHAAADLLGLWVSTSGVFLLLLPEKVEVWMLPLQASRHGAQRHEKVLRREKTGHLLKAAAQSEGEGMSAVFEEAFDTLVGGVPEVLISLATPQSQKLRQAVFTVLPCKRILIFNERSRLLVCWDAVASAAVGFVLPMPLNSTAILTPHWATLLPARGCLRITGASSSRGDIVVLGAGTQWYLWTFEIGVTHALLRASKFGSSVEDAKESASPRERSSPKRRRGRNTISGRLAEAESSSSGRKTNTRFTMMMRRDRQAVFELRKQPDVKRGTAGEVQRTVQTRFPLMPASTGACLRPAAWWLEKVAGASQHAAQPSRAPSEGTSSRTPSPEKEVKRKTLGKEERRRTRSKSPEPEAISSIAATVAEPTADSSEEQMRKEESRKATARQGWQLLRKLQRADSELADKEDAKTNSDTADSHLGLRQREGAGMHATRTPPLSCTRTERSKPSQPVHALPSSKQNELHVGTGPERQPIRVPSRPKSRCTPEPARARSACTPEPARASSAFGRLGISPLNMTDIEQEFETPRLSDRGVSLSNPVSRASVCRSPSPFIEVSRNVQVHIKRCSTRGPPVSARSSTKNDHSLSRFQAELVEIAEQRTASRQAQRRGDQRRMMGVSVDADGEGDIQGQDVEEMAKDGHFNWEIPIVSPAAPPALLQPRMKTGALGSPVRFWPKST